MDRQKQGYFWLCTGLIAAGIAAALGSGFPREGKPPLIGALDWTGRLAFFVFLIPYFASPLRSLMRNAVTQTLLRWRRNAGIVYGAVQCVHIVLILQMFTSMEHPPVLPGMAEIGSLGLLLCTAMLVTSFEGPQRAIGAANWRRLHKSGMYVFAFIYVYEFVTVPLMTGNWEHFRLLAALISAGVVLRTWVWISRNRQQSN